MTVDPDYDTSVHLKNYLEYVDPRYMGISDQRQRLDRELSIDYKKFKIQKTHIL